MINDYTTKISDPTNQNEQTFAQELTFANKQWLFEN